MTKDILVCYSHLRKLSTNELARTVKQAIGVIENRISSTGVTIDPEDKRAVLREEINHYLELAPYKPPISVEGYLD